MDRLVQWVDRLSLMTYDYAKTPTRFPNAPLPFVRDSVLSICGSQKAKNKKVMKKILIGVPWYGFDNGQVRARRCHDDVHLTAQSFIYMYRCLYLNSQSLETILSNS